MTAAILPKLLIRNKISVKYPLAGVVLLVASLLAFSNVADAATYYSRVATGTFATAGTWSTSPTGTPTNVTAIANADIFIIQNGHNITVGASRTIAQITINAGGTLTLATFILTISGNWTNDGTITGSTGRMTASTGTLINNNIINFTGAGGIVKSTGTLTNAATGTITIVGTGLFTLGNSGNFVNNNTSANVNLGSTAVTLTGTTGAQQIGGFITTGRITSTRTGGSGTFMGNVNCAGITMNGAGGTLNLGAGLTHNCSNTVILTNGTLNGGSSTLNVSVVSATAWQGTASNFSAGTGTVNFNAGGNQTISATGTRTFNNLTLSTSGTKTIATTTVNGILSMEGTATASAAPTYGTNATLQYNRTANQNTGAEWPASFTAGTLTGGVVIANTGDITLATAAKVLGAGMPLTINSGAVLVLGQNLTLQDDLVNNGGTVSGASNLSFTGTAAQSIGAFSITGTVTANKSDLTATFTDDVTGGPFVINNTATGILNLGTGHTHSFSTFTRTAGTLEGGTSILNISGAVTNTAGTFTPENGRVNFTGASGQTIPPLTYYDLGFSGAGTKTIAAASTITVTNDWIVGSVTTMTTTGSVAVAGSISSTGNITMGTGTLTVTGDWSNSGIFTRGTGTVHFNGTTQNIPALSYHNLQVSQPGEKALTGGTTVNNILTIGAASELNAGANTLTLTASGTPFVNNGIFTAGTSTVSYSSASSANIAAVDYFNLNGTGGARTLPAAATIGILGTFIPGAGSYTVPADNIVDFKGTGNQNIPAFTFGRLIVSNAGIKRILASVIVGCQTIDVEDDASVEINADGGGRLNVLN